MLSPLFSSRLIQPAPGYKFGPGDLVQNRGWKSQETSQAEESKSNKVTWQTDKPPQSEPHLILPISIQVPPSIQWCSCAQSRAPSLLRLASFNWGWVRSVQGGCSALRSKPGKNNQTWQSFAIKVWMNQNAWPLQKLLLSEMKVAPVACFSFWKLRKVLERLNVYLCHVYVLVFTAEIKQRQWYKLHWGPKCPASIGQPSSAHQTHQDRICYPKPNHIIVTGTWNHLKLDMCKIPGSLPKVRRMLFMQIVLEIFNLVTASRQGRWSPERPMGLLLSHSCIYSSHGCLSVHICRICMSNIYIYIYVMRYWG